MKVLFIGGTGTISTAITANLIEKGHDVYLLNRGSRNEMFGDKVHWLKGDINDEEKIMELLGDEKYDVVCDFIGFTVDQVQRDYRLFKGRTKQYMYISSASAYHKPVKDYRITEATALVNPYWQYSRDKIECEDFLMDCYRKEGFPVTIIRPSHTYDLRSVPLGVHGDKGSYQVVKRIKEGKPVIIQGDGTTLWTITSNVDFADGFVGLMGNPHAIGEAFQITNDESLTWNQIYQIIADYFNVELKAYHVSSEFLAAVSDYDLTGGLLGDKSNTVVFDNTKVKRAIPGFAPHIRAEEGLKKTLDYIMSHPEYQVEDPEYDKWCDIVIEELEETKAKLRNKLNL